MAIHELIHTSAERGIRTRGSGFTTVAMSEGMPAALADRLESMSALDIRAISAQPTGELAGNMAGEIAVLQHVILRVAGVRWHVVSRIAPCGLDYSGRANRIAHHLAIDTPTRMSVSPIALLRAPGVFTTRWDEPPRLLRERPVQALPALPVTRSPTWAAVAGDAGWSAAPLRANRRGATIVTVVPPGVDAAVLVVESSALLSIAEAWTLTFCTAFVAPQPDVECRWRLCRADAPIRSRLLATPGAVTIDLGAPVGACEEDELTVAARRGQTIAARQRAVAPSRTGSVAAVESTGAPGSTEATHPAGGVHVSSPALSAASSLASSSGGPPMPLELAGLRGPGSRRRAIATSPIEASTGAREREASHRSRREMVTIVALVGVLLLGVVVVLLLTRSGPVPMPRDAVADDHPEEVVVDTAPATDAEAPTIAGGPTSAVASNAEPDLASDARSEPAVDSAVASGIDSAADADVSSDSSSDVGESGVDDGASEAEPPSENDDRDVVNDDPETTDPALETPNDSAIEPAGAPPARTGLFLGHLALGEGKSFDGGDQHELWEPWPNSHDPTRGGTGDPAALFGFAWVVAGEGVRDLRTFALPEGDDEPVTRYRLDMSRPDWTLQLVERWRYGPSPLRDQNFHVVHRSRGDWIALVFRMVELSGLTLDLGGSKVRVEQTSGAATLIVPVAPPALPADAIFAARPESNDASRLHTDASLRVTRDGTAPPAIEIEMIVRDPVGRERLVAIASWLADQGADVPPSGLGDQLAAPRREEELIRLARELFDSIDGDANAEALHGQKALAVMRSWLAEPDAAPVGTRPLPALVHRQNRLREAKITALTLLGLRDLLHNRIAHDADGVPKIRFVVPEHQSSTASP